MVLFTCGKSKRRPLNDSDRGVLTITKWPQNSAWRLASWPLRSGFPAMLNILNAFLGYFFKEEKIPKCLKIYPNIKS